MLIGKKDVPQRKSIFIKRELRKDWRNASGSRQNPPGWFKHQSGCGPRECARRVRQMA